MEYKQVAIPKALADRFDKIRRYYGYRSFSEFVVGLVRDGVHELEQVHEQSKQDDKEKGEHE